MIRVRVHRRFSDLDPLGHVNNVVFHDYLQEARVSMLQDLSNVQGPGFAHVVAQQDIKHLKPLLLHPDPVMVETWIEHVGNSSYRVGYRVIDEHGDCAAEASTVMAVVDPDSGRPIRMPDELRDILTALTIDR